MFACLRNDLYTVANIQNLHVLTYHKQTRMLPFAKLVSQDVGLFSEEAGEIAFSLLSRSTLGDSVEDKHRRLTDCFQSIGAMREIKLDCYVDEGSHKATACKTTVSQTDDEVVALEQHYLGVLRALADGSFRYYSTPDALKRTNRFKGLWSSAPSTALKVEPESQLHRVWNKVSGVDLDWGQQFAERVGYRVPEPPADIASGHSPVMSPLTSASRSPEPVRRKRTRRTRRQAADNAADSAITPASLAGMSRNFTNFFYIKKCDAIICLIGQPSPVLASLDANEDSSQCADLNMRNSTSVAPGGEVAVRENTDVGGSLEEAFLASAAQLDGRKRARVRTNHWPLWNHGDDDTVAPH